MRLVQTLVVRNEVDVVDAQLAYHLNAGVDFVIATDNGSRDGTVEILERYAREGHLRLIRETGPIRDGPWRTRMARLAATEHGADWVINTDADEFWMPRRGTLKEASVAVPERVGVIWAVTRHFVPRPDDDLPFSERMTVRFASAGAALNDPTSPYRPHGEGRASRRPRVRRALRLPPRDDRARAAAALAPRRRPSLPVPERRAVRAQDGAAGSQRQPARAVRAWLSGARVRPRGGRLRRARRHDATLTRGFDAGSLAEDTRLRDALRGSGEGAGADGLATGVAVDAQAFREAEIVRLVRFVDDLGARVGVVERRARVRRL